MEMMALNIVEWREKDPCMLRSSSVRKICMKDLNYKCTKVYQPVKKWIVENKRYPYTRCRKHQKMYNTQDKESITYSTTYIFTYMNNVPKKAK